MFWHISISFLVLGLTMRGQSLEVDTPIFVASCSNAHLVWSGGVPPYIVYLSPPRSVSISGDFHQTSLTSLNLGVGILPGEGGQFVVHVNDSANTFATSGVFTIAPCPNNDGSVLTITSQVIISQDVVQTQTTSTSITTTTTLTGVKSGPSSDVTIGGMIGGLLLLTIVIGSTLWYQRRKCNRHPILGDSVVHVFEVAKTSAVPGRSKSDTLQRASGRPPPRGVPVGPSTTANRPRTDVPVRALGSSNPPQQGSSSSHSPPPDSPVLGSGHPSSSGPPRTIEIHSPPAYLLTPQSDDPFQVPLSPRPPTYVTTDMPQSDLPESDPFLVQNVVERNLTDGDVEAIARRLMEMQRDQRS